MFRLARIEDLSAIVSIYNQTIQSKTITADLKPVTPEARYDWFMSHLNHEKYPLWVLEQEGTIQAWCSYSQFYSRAAYDETTEISFYIDRHYHGQGLGHQILQFLIDQMPNYKMTTLLALVFAHNHKSLSLLKKYDFQQFGLLPQIANMQDFYESLVILGYQSKA